MKRILVLVILMFSFGVAIPSSSLAISIDSGDIIDGEVKAADIGFNAISTTRIADGAVTSAKIFDGTVAAIDLAADAVTSAKILDGEVDTADIATGAVTDVKITGPISAAKIQTLGLDADTLDGFHATAFAPAVVGTANIADSAITNIKIPDNEITAQKISDGDGSGLDADMLDGFTSSEFSKKYGNVVVVAQSGGDFTSIQAAIDSIIDASETNLYIIKVMPGTYTDSTITMKSYVSLQGSGRSTIIDTGSSGTIDLTGTVNNSIKDFELWTSIDCNACIALTVSGNFFWGYNKPAIDVGSAPASDYAYNIYDNLIFDMSRGITISFSVSGNYYIRNNVFKNVNNGLWVDRGAVANLSVSGNFFECSGCTQQGITLSGVTSGRVSIVNNLIKGYAEGVYLKDTGATMKIKVAGNEISENSAIGITLVYALPSAIIDGNIITGNNYGIKNCGSACNATVTNNRITGSTTTDVYDPSPTSVYSYNVYDTYVGTVAGAYNSKSDGTTW